MKSVMSAAALAASLVCLPASAVVVGGIDFGPQGSVSHLETATLAETYVNAVGQELRGYGYITTVNGQTDYCAGAGSCGLYYYFHDYTVSEFSAQAVRFEGGIIDVYYAAGSPLDLLSQNSNDNVATITGMTEWTRFVGADFNDPIVNAILGTVGTQTLSGIGSLVPSFPDVTISTTGTGMLNSDTSGVFGIAAVADYFDTNTIGNGLGGFADIRLTASSDNTVLNPNDVADGLADGCSNGTASPGEWCFQGTLNIRGDVNYVAEPSSLALAGLALIGAGITRRRRRVSR